jgi:TRAP-type uncharacterized transport system substrate-binding protein
MNRLLTGLLAAAVAALGLATAGAQDKKVRLSITTGGTGGVYYPLGGGLAALLSKHVPVVEATAEVTAGSIANLQLIDSGKSELGFTMADAAWDAYQGLDKFTGKKVALRTLVVFYPNRMHVVTVEGTGINKFADLKGKRVSTGAPASGTEITALRLIEAHGLNPAEMTRERLSVAESVNALKGRQDRRLLLGGRRADAVDHRPGGNARQEDQADRPRRRRREHEEEGRPDLREEQDPRQCLSGAGGRHHQHGRVEPDRGPEKADEQLIYNITKTMFEKKDELVKVHKDASFLELANQTTNASPIPFHPGAIRYFKRRG